MKNIYAHRSDIICEEIIRGIFANLILGISYQIEFDGALNKYIYPEEILGINIIKIKKY